ncbi:CYTH domain-containing protein [Pararobbsia alpina]|uniref:Inorganic triphosphatase n=1 Tax=Pararobbsia alpina TaxID=621374 RepID=A0A6S7D6C6_9BURK|nr:CYTH domain-containing protein [Pararobbsia alpina]CAB3797347.1 Inorganic triphosphatase [Pararobbsia alpina]
MSVESELKLALPREHATLARQVLDQLAGGAGRSIHLANVYYDTPALDLQRSRSALRLRLAGTHWLQTFKSGGGASAGLHRRHEWEMPVDRDALDADALLEAVEKDLGPAQSADSEERVSLQQALQSLRSALPQLSPLFRTDFTRTLWNLVDGDNQIEAALDEGEVSVGEGALRDTLPILEIELELKQGDEAALHRVATILRERIPGLAHDDISKAERGYRLRAKLQGTT